MQKLIVIIGLIFLTSCNRVETTVELTYQNGDKDTVIDRSCTKHNYTQIYNLSNGCASINYGSICGVRYVRILKVKQIEK